MMRGAIARRRVTERCAEHQLCMTPAEGSATNRRRRRVIERCWLLPAVALLLHAALPLVASAATPVPPPLAHQQVASQQEPDSHAPAATQAAQEGARAPAATQAAQEGAHAPAATQAAQEGAHAPAATQAGQEGDHAAEGHDDQGEHAAEPKPWFYWPSKFINFVLLLALMYWLLVIPPPAIQETFSFPGLKVIFVDRAAAIIAARDLAAQQQRESGAMRADSEQRLAKIEDEVAALVAEAERDANDESLRAVEDGKAQAAKILEVADRDIAHQRTLVQRRLRRLVADLAVTMAEKNLSEHLTAEDQDRLIREYLSRLGPSMA